MRRRRVLLLTPDYPPAFGGIQLLLHRLACHLDGWDVEVLTLGDRGDPPDPGGPRVHRTPLGGGRIPRIAAAAGLNAAAVPLALRLRPDVVLSGHVVAAPAALAVRRLLGIPFVQYVHANEVPHRPSLSRRALHGAHTVVAVSRASAELAVAHGAAPSQVRVVLPGVDPATPRRAARSTQPLVVTVSRMRELYKGHDVALRALALVAARVPEVRWAFVGDGPLLARSRAAAEAAGLGDRVVFPGAVSNQEREAWLDRAHVFAMPSRRSGHGGGEGFGIVYVEAAVRGLPVVAGDDGGARDAVLHGETGLLVDARDHVAVAEAVAELLLDPARAEAMGRRGAERAASLTWAAMAAQVAEVLDAAVASRSAAAA